MGTRREDFDGNKTERRNLDTLKRMSAFIENKIVTRQRDGLPVDFYLRESAALQWVIVEIERIRSVETLAGRA